MKKLTILIVAMLFSAGMAFAQNSATTTATGNNNDTNIDQVYVGSGDVNQATTTQVGDDNRILAPNQVGNGNVLTIDQIGNNNTIESHGEQGFSNAPSYDGTIDIDQAGDNNGVWDSDQVGFSNTLTINQDGDDFANADAQVSTGETGNTMTITQLGGSNFVGEYSSNGAGAYQEGDANNMTITQSGGAEAGVQDTNPNGTPQNRFFRPQEGGQGLIQFGDGNMMEIDQEGMSTVTFILQEGNGNDAWVTQTGAGHTANTTQFGDGNTSTITQN